MRQFLADQYYEEEAASAGKMFRPKSCRYLYTYGGRARARDSESESEREGMIEKECAGHRRPSDTHPDDDPETRSHKKMMRQFLADQYKEEEQDANPGKMSRPHKGAQIGATQVRPLLMPEAARQKLVGELATRMGGGSADSGGKEAHRLLQMLESEDQTHVGVEIGVQVVAELMKDVLNGFTKSVDQWRVMNPLGVACTVRPGDSEICERICRNAVITVQAVQGDYLVLPPQRGLGFKRIAYLRIRHPNGRKNMQRVTKLQSKLPMMKLLIMLSHYRHACVELSKIPRLIETLAYWMTERGEKEVQGMAFQLLQRLQTAAKLLRGAGDGGHVETMRRSLSTRSAPIAPELHALRTNKGKFPPQELDVAIVMNDGSPSRDKEDSAGGVADKRRIMPDHLKPVPLTYGIGLRSIISPAPILSLRYQAAHMVLHAPSRPYTSLIGDFPIDSSVCTFDRVRI